MRIQTLVVALIITSLSAVTLSADPWPQFRGRNATGVSHEQRSLPVELGPDKNVVWKTDLAKGHSSPVVAAGRVFVTALDDKQLVTICLDAKNGGELWRRVAPYEKLESVHSVGSPATSSVATDGERVYSFFGSSGLYCYSLAGEEIWRRRLGPFNNQFGAMSSPVLADDKLVMIQDHDTGSHLEARDKRTGEIVWRVERPNMRRNYSSPVIWEVDGRRQVVIAGTAHVMGYDLETGEFLWQVAGICRVVSSTPVVGDDGKLYVAATGGGETPPQPSFDELLAAKDTNKNGGLEQDELPSSPIKGFFGQFDRDADGSLSREEYESIREIFSLSRSVAMAIRPGGRGDVTDTHVEWDYGRSICRNASPLLVDGVLFFVKDGGIFTSLNAKTGEVGRQARLAGTGKYFSSPVSGDGKIYVVSDRGELNVLSAELDWKQLGEAEFGEDVYATPAISDGRIYIRTVKSLYCFGIDG
jgi:outer membrane protein assembly factor BamB